ncbi:MAG: hypothetical protein ACK5JT_15520, partial [Hyphomicrobiaceae bacterium]
MAFSGSLRRMVGLAVLTPIAAGLLTATASADDKIVLNFNLFGPKRANTAGIEALVDFYTKESKGKVEIKLVYGSALGPEKQTPSAIKAGGYEGGMMCTGYYPGRFPMTNVMELPFLPPAKIEDR